MILRGGPSSTSCDRCIAVAGLADVDEMKAEGLARRGRSIVDGLTFDDYIR